MFFVPSSDHGRGRTSSVSGLSVVHPHNRGMVLPGGGFEAGGWRPESGSGLQRGKLGTKSLSEAEKQRWSYNIHSVDCIKVTTRK